MPANISDLCSQYEKLKSSRGIWDTWHQELGDHVSPRRGQVTESGGLPNDDKESRLYDPTALQSNMVLAQGQMSYVTPKEDTWLVAEPPDGVTDNAAVRWYSQCGERMLLALAASNAYTELHEFYLDRGGFGTSNLYVEESMTNRSGLVFDCVPIGSYSIAENEEKMVDTVFRDREMTAVQMEQRWGIDALPKAVQKALKKADQRWQTFTVVHAVQPRYERDTMKLDRLNLPFSSCWFMPGEKHLLSESGYETMPYLVSRYLRWGKEVYGWCPGFTALPASRQLQHLERLMDGLAEVELFPRMLLPSNLEGEVDLSAGGVTIYNPFQGGKPEMWGTGGNYRYGVERADVKRKQIEVAYHTDLFKMFSLIEKQMTAREVAERAGEKLIQFSPTFSRLDTEMLTPLLDRVFRIMMRQGKFPDPPPSVLAMDQLGPHVRPPRVVFKSRVALAIRALQSSGFMNMLEALTPLIQVDPSVRHVIKIDTAARGLARNFGVPEDWMRTEEEYQSIVSAEQQALAAQQQAEAATQMIGTAGKLKPEQIEAVAKAMGGAAA